MAPDSGIGQVLCQERAPDNIRMPQPVDPMQLNDTRELIIVKALNGFIVRVGCRNVVFETQEKMLKEIGRYLDNPMNVEKEYMNKK